MKFTVLLTLFAATASASVSLEVTLDGRTLDVRRDGAIVASYPISPGVDKHPTPKGNFSIRKIVWNPRWVPPKEKWAKDKKPQPPGHPKNPMKIVKIFFQEPDYYLHGTADEHLLGDAASHGCIRMSPSDAYALARFLMDSSGVKKSDEWYRSVIEGRRSKTIRLRQRVPMHIGP